MDMDRREAMKVTAAAMASGAFSEVSAFEVPASHWAVVVKSKNRLSPQQRTQIERVLREQWIGGLPAPMITVLDPDLDVEIHKDVRVLRTKLKNRAADCLYKKGLLTANEVREDS